MSNEIKLKWSVVQAIDLSGYGFYVEEGGLFDVADFAEYNNINQYDIDQQDVHSAQDAASKLSGGRFLLVEIA